MPILDLQRRLRELGRIRTGEKVPGSKGPRPSKLDRFRLTSPSQPLIDAAAEAFGSDKRGVRLWTNPFDKSQEYEVVVSSETLAILVPPGQSLSQWWELYTAGGAERRCDGQREQLGDRPCLCPPAGKERAELAANGKACKPTTRLNVILPQLPDVGVWRLESHGYYAAVELAGTAELLERATRAGRLVPAQLRLDQRTVKRPGQATRNFAVPVIEIPDASARLALTVDLDNPDAPVVAQLPGTRVPPQLPGGAPLPTETSIAISGNGNGRAPAEASEREAAKPATTPRTTRRSRNSQAAPTADSADGQANGPASEPACEHPPAKYETRDGVGVVCTDCGTVIAHRAETRPRAAAKKPGDPEYWTARIHAAGAKKGLEHEDLRLIAAAVCGIDPEALTLPDDDESRFSVKQLVDAEWEAVDELLRGLPARLNGADADADLDAISAWVWPRAEAKQLDSWEAINVLAAAASGRADADELTVAEWIAWATRLAAGEYDAAPQRVAVEA